MANIKSQIKRIKQNEVRRERNKAVRSEIRTRAKTAIVAADNNSEDVADRLRIAASRIDKAAAKGVIHKNEAARRKSRLMRHANAARAAAEATE
jgi:small subunit ribosomal protein S20